MCAGQLCIAGEMWVLYLGYVFRFPMYHLWFAYKRDRHHLKRHYVRVHKAIGLATFSREHPVMNSKCGFWNRLDVLSDALFITTSSVIWKTCRFYNVETGQEIKLTKVSNGVRSCLTSHGEVQFIYMIVTGWITCQRHQLLNCVQQHNAHWAAVICLGTDCCDFLLYRALYVFCLCRHCTYCSHRFNVHRFRAKCQQQDRIHFRQSGGGGHLYHLYHLYEDTVSDSFKNKQDEDVVTLPPADTAPDIATRR